MQSLVHFKSTEWHLHLLLPVQDVLQPHFTNSLHSLLASNCVIQFGVHLTASSSVSIQPKSFGDGRFCIVSRHLLQTPLWKRALFVCKRSAFFVGGIVSIFCVQEKYKSIRASLTLFIAEVREYMSTTNLCIFLNLSSSLSKFWKGLAKSAIFTIFA